MKFKLRRYYIYYAGRCLAFIFYLLPIRISLNIGSFFGAVAFHVAARYRRIAMDNLTMVFGDKKSSEEIKRIGICVFRNLAKNAVELVNLPKINKENIGKFVKIENADTLEGAFRNGKGVIILTAHFGSWELLALGLRVNYPGVTIGRKIYFKKYDEYLNKLRKANDVHVIYRDSSPRSMLKVLKENRILGIVADQDVDSVDGVFVNFFGKPAYTPTGPVMLAKVSGAPIIPAFIIRQKDNTHKLVIEKPVELVDTGDKEKDVIANTQRWSDVVESYIEKYPEQWVWMHKRWKTKEKN